MYDAAIYYGTRTRADTLEKFGLQSKQYVLATIHRAENTDRRHYPLAGTDAGTVALALTPLSGLAIGMTQPIFDVAPEFVEAHDLPSPPAGRRIPAMARASLSHLVVSTANCLRPLGVRR